VKLRRGRSVIPRPGWLDGLERTEPLRGQLWTRSEKSLKPPDVHWGWRGMAAAIAVLEAALLLWLWFGPAFAVRTVEVTGSRHLTAAQIATAAGISSDGSVVSIDGTAAQQRLLDQVWIRTATVEAELPGTVVITVSEWQPVAAYHAGPSSKVFLLSSQAVVLGPTPTNGGLLDVQGPAGADPRVGDRPIEATLLTAMVNIQRARPTLLGQDVAGFVFDSCGDLTMTAKRGWKVYFGRVLTPEEFDSLRDKLTALKAIAGKNMVDYGSADLLYVNVMNPSEPAVGYKSRQPAPPSPTPGATPTPPLPNPCK
jgi:cell division protein FtsQ